MHARPQIVPDASEPSDLEIVRARLAAGLASLAVAVHQTKVRARDIETQRAFHFALRARAYAAAAKGLTWIRVAVVCRPCIAETIYKSPNPRRSTWRSIFCKLRFPPTNERVSPASSWGSSSSS